MIKYNLKCQNNHEFESWFSDSKEFEKLKTRKMLECIFCNSKKIDKSIMSPMISVSKNYKKKNSNISLKLQKEKKDLLKIRDFVEKNFEFVGDEFSKKVREIYYDKQSNKTIYGTTTQKERDELAEEGIEILSVPWTNKEN